MIVEPDRTNLRLTPEEITTAEWIARLGFTRKPGGLECLEVTYEALVDSPGPEFKRVLEFFELDCQLDEQSLGKKVSLYSSEPRRPRGKSYSWKAVQKEYSHIIRQVNHLLEDEIKGWGYEL